MDIKKSNIKGKLKSIIIQNDETLKLDFEIPILFTSINSGPKGLNNVMVEKVQVKDYELFPSTNATFHPYLNNENSICGEEIVSPIEFRDTENNNSNLLILSFSIETMNNSLKDYLMSDGLKKIDFLSSFNFINSRSLELKIGGEFTKLEHELISIKTIKRNESAFLTKMNLLLLITLIAALSIWNYKINRKVYLQDEYLTQEAITGFIAIFATFLGLSFTKIRGLFAVLSNITAFFKFPEIHLSLVQFDNFSSKVWLAVIGICIISASIFFTKFNPVKIEENFKHGIYDTYEKEYVDLEKFDRFYPATLLSNDENSNRFEIHNKSIDSLKTQAVSIGNLNYIEKEIEYYKYDVRYRRNNLDTIIHDKTASYLIKTKNIFDRELPFQEIFDKKEKQKRIGNLFITYNFSGNKRTINISDSRNVSEDEIVDLISVFIVEEEIKTKNLDIINKDRIALIEKLKNRFDDSFGENGIVSKKLILSLTNKLISETSKGGNITKKTIERYIYLTSLWQASEDNIDNSEEERMTSLDLISICNSIKPTLEIYQGVWKRDRIIMSFILEVQKQIGATESDAIVFIDKIILCNKPCGRSVNLLDFIVSSSIASANDLSVVQDYIKDKLPAFRTRLILDDSYLKLFEAFKKYEESDARNKDFIYNNKDILKSIKSLFKQVS